MTLDLAQLPEYALRSTLRMFAALAASLMFTFTVATLAAKSRHAALLIIPALDILQSVPVLGFLTFTLTLFMGLFPGNQLGAEAVAIFTSQAWNIAFSFYQSLTTLPTDLDEVSRQSVRLFALAALYPVGTALRHAGAGVEHYDVDVGGWFFVVPSEAITVGDTHLTLPGIGSWLALAIDRADFRAVGWGVFAMGLVILL